MVPSYAGITTTLAANVDNANHSECQFDDLSTLDVNIGDYLMVDDELVRVKTTNAEPTHCQFSVVFLEPRQQHTISTLS